MLQCFADLGVMQVLMDQLSYGPACNLLMMSYIALVIEGAPCKSSLLLLMDHQ
jgi:hypothetical protein